MKVIISRVDNLGDVILTLPLAGYLKSLYADQCEIYFIGKSYTKDIITSCIDVDHFLSFDESLEYELKKIKADWIFHIFPNKEISRIAKKLKIPHRVGTKNRFFHWFTCNDLVSLSRKNSNLHEAQLNLKLLSPLTGDISCESKNLHKYISFNIEAQNKNEKRVIMHVLSNESAPHWPMDSYKKLAQNLYNLGYEVCLTGTEKEGLKIREIFEKELQEGICRDVTGKFSLKELMVFIKSSYALFACSTGPLHLAGTLGIHTFGFYSKIRPLHVGRWGALGRHIYLFEASGEKDKPNLSSITSEDVLDQFTTLA